MPSPLTLADAIARLQRPGVFEDFSALTGEALFAVDLGADAAWPDELALAVAREALAELPCPSVALAPDLLEPAAEALVGAFDVRVETRVELAEVERAARAQPLAALALVQLLRGAAGRSVHEGLVAESWVYSVLQSGPEFGAWLAQRGPARASEPPDRPPVRVERGERRLEITLDRAEKRNAYSSAMRDALCAALEVAVLDGDVERLVLRGEGPVFCSGGDLDEFGTTPDPATAHAVRSTRHPARWLHALEARTEVFVHGACVGAGIELPAFAARVVARPGAWFQLPELSMGLVPGAGGTVSLTRRVGRQRCARLALTGARLDAPTALEWGLVDEIAA